ncbi:MAG TPA: prepilin-type N-terminal cleavage/methylation domain-containing protein [Blastocatellia bacterium]|nr:prepilin-type N-terminal cleavage/methylation domain-containing protein [Blastocatellia bacterium]
MENQISSDNHRTTEQRGFTIVETVIAIAVFTIVMASIYGLLEVGRRGRSNTLQRNEVLQNARIAVNYISRDIINAGVSYPIQGALLPDDRLNGLGLSATPDVDPDFDSLSPVFSSNNIDLINGVQTDQVTLAYLDDAFNNGRGLALDQIDITGANSVVRVRAPDNNAGVTVGDVYMVSGNNGVCLVTVTGLRGPDQIELSFGDPLGFNQVNATADSALRNILMVPAGCVNCTTAISATLVKIRLVSYRLTSDGVNPNGILIRRIYGGRDAGGNPVNFQDQPLAFGVDNFQVRYVLNDGTVTNSPVKNALLDEFQLITQVEVLVAVSSAEVDPRTNQPFRQTLTTGVSTRNLVYERQ